MGCGPSKPANPAASLVKELDSLGSVPELEWAYRPIWGQYIDYIYEHAKENGDTRQFRQNFNKILNSTAKDFLAVEYPDCAKAGTTEDMGDDVHPFGNDSSPCVATKTFITLDEGFNGIMYASTLVVNSPMAWKSVSDGANSALPGSIMDAPQTKLAQRYLTTLVHGMEQQDVNVKHSVLNIIIGSVMVSARYKPHNLIPSSSLISENASAELPAPKPTAEKRDGVDTSQTQLPFRSHLFMSVLKSLETNYPGCTIWDAGEMTFEVGDKPYPGGARFLICRDFAKRNKDVQTFDFKVKGPNSDGNETVATILRARDPSEDPGGIVCLAVIVNVDPEDPWPKRDMEKHLPIIGAALGEASLNGMVLSFLNGFERSGLRIWAGQDTRHYTLITPHTKGQTAEHVQQFSELLFGGPLTPLKTASNLEDGTDLEAIFGVKLKKQEEHQLWQSESQFQNIRQEMRERAKQDPERYAEIFLLAGHETTARFMQNNFGGCVISEEGELPQPDLKGAAKLENTKIRVARDPKQEPSSIVAVVASVPCPVPGYSPMVDKNKTWLGTPELKQAEDALMAVLKQWYSDGKISKVDCFAQVMMGMDASTYQFVDGDKFIDYPDERMEQIKWQ